MVRLAPRFDKLMIRPASKVEMQRFRSEARRLVAPLVFPIDRFG
jgi:hypothetical protein